MGTKNENATEILLTTIEALTARVAALETHNTKHCVACDNARVRASAGRAQAAHAKAVAEKQAAWAAANPPPTMTRVRYVGPSNERLYNSLAIVGGQLRAVASTQGIPAGDIVDGSTLLAQGGEWVMTEKLFKDRKVGDPDFAADLAAGKLASEPVPLPEATSLHLRAERDRQARLGASRGA
jgi:hypothetical protein